MRGPGRRRTHVVRAAVGIVAALVLVPVLAQAPEPAKGIKFPAISQADLKEWLTYLSSDELQGRQVFTEGYGVAAQYVAERLRQFGVKPLGEDGTYFQIVKLRSYKVIRNSSVTLEANGQSRTFTGRRPCHVPAASGGRQTVVLDGGEFVGAGQPADFSGRNVAGKLVVVMAAPAAGRGGRGRNAFATQTAGARAVVEYVAPRRAADAGRRGTGAGAGQPGAGPTRP